MEYTVAFLISSLLFVLGYLIGIKKKMHLLSGYEEENVTDADALAKSAGIYLSLLGLSFIPLPFLNDWIGVSVVILYLFIFYICLYSMFVYTKRFTKS